MISGSFGADCSLMTTFPHLFGRLDISSRHDLVCFTMEGWENLGKRAELVADAKSNFLYLITINFIFGQPAQNVCAFKPCLF